MKVFFTGDLHFGHENVLRFDGRPFATVEEMRDAYDKRRRFVLSSLSSIGLSCFEPEGAFYVYPNIGGFGMTSEEFCERLLYSKKVALVPGTAFGESGEGYVRASYCYSLSHIKLALSRIKEFLEELKAE